MTLTPKMNIWTEALLACSVACLVLILPSIVADELMNGTQSGKFFLFIYSLLGILILCSVVLLFKKELSFHFTIIDLLLTLFVGWVSLNNYLLHDVHALSLRYFELVGLFILYVIVRSVDRKYYTLFLVAICIAGLVQAVYGNLQLWGYYPSHHGLFKMTGSFFNPGPYAGFLAALLPVALGLYWSLKDYTLQVSSWRGLKLTSFMFNRFESEDSNTKNQTQSLEHEESNKSNHFEQLLFVAIKYLSLITIVLILLVLPATRSRAAWLGALAGCAFIVWHKYNLKLLFKRVIIFRNRTIITLLALLLIAGSVSLYFYKKDSADGRILIWQVTTTIIKDYPLLGVGQDLFKAHYMDYQADYFRNHPGSKYEIVADDNQYAFNEFINTWAENGLIGFLLFLSIVAMVFLPPINHEGKKEVAQPSPKGYRDFNLTNETITKASILAILVFGMFAYPSEILPIKIVAVICLGVLANYNALNPSNYQTRSIKRKASNGEAFNPSNIQTLFKLTLTCLALFLTIGGYTKINELRQAYKTWNDAFELYNYGLNTECLDNYQKALPLLHYNGEFMINYGKALSIAEKHDEAIEILGKAKNYQTNSVLYTALGDSQKALKQYTNAEKNYWLASNMAPSKFYSQYLLAKLYDETKQTQKAIDIATSLLKKTVKVESTAIKEIHDEMEKIIKRNTTGYSQLISNNENTNKRQKGRNNHTSPQKTAMLYPARKPHLLTKVPHKWDE